MIVREATPDDYDEISRLTIAAYRALDTWVGDGYATELADVAGRVAAGGTVLVAEEDGCLVGSVTLTLEPGPLFEWEHGVDGDSGFRMLAVDPRASRRGAGRMLVRECVRRARDAGRKRMVIGSTTWMTVAHRMYGGFGFRRCPEMDQQWGDITGWCFVLDLDDVPAGCLTPSEGG